MAGWVDKRPELLAEIRAYLAARHPDLHLRIIGGRASIHGSFAITDGGGVVDRFQVIIRFPDDYPVDTPTLEEVGGRIPRAQERHVEPNGIACLTVPEEWHFLSKDRSFAAFIEGPIKNFLVSQSTYEATGQWPFGERPHGYDGLIDAYGAWFGSNDPAVIRSHLRYLAAETPKGHWDCPCGSGKKIRRCSHRDRLAELRSKFPTDAAQRTLKRFEQKGAQLELGGKSSEQ